MPRLTDVVNDAFCLYQHAADDEDLEFLGVDTADAFNNIPVRPDESRFLCAAIQGKYMVFDSLVFGAGLSPTVLGRYAALLGRALSSLF